MDHRALPGTQRPPPVQRSLSGGSFALQHGLRRPPLPSGLSHVRSVSHSVVSTDLTPATTHVGQFTAPPFAVSHADVYASPEGLSLDDDDADRPAKRAKIADIAPESETCEEESIEALPGAAYRIVPGTALPRLSSLNRSAKKNKSPRTRDIADRAARRANGLEAPSMATRIATARKVADFAPWNAQHPEDIMSEKVIQAGFFDKGPGQNSAESSSAKQPIMTNISTKNSVCLQVLSQVFATVMDKRQNLGKCTTASTFRPPPRVTIPDAKREAWVRDLANPEVPLRKLSRGLPHGITGKVLLEHCLGKSIPLPRAVWLARVVGANELRAFRRKGHSGSMVASGEARWLREWTVKVEQFVEEVIASIGEPEWRVKMDYTVKIAASFFSERLLDQEHYVDWVVASFAQAPIERLPIWAVLVQLYWKNIVASGRRGRKLAEAILRKLVQLDALDTYVDTAALRLRLHKLISVLAVAHRGCLVLPRVWNEYRQLFTSQEQTMPDDLGNLAAAHTIVTRNDRLATVLTKTSENTCCPELSLCALLDSVGLDFDIEKLAAATTASVPEPDKLVHALLEWSSTVHRTGLRRIYLTASLIAQLRATGHDVDAAVLTFLQTADPAALDVDNVYRVVNELIHLEAFAPGRYMQWLLTNGTLSNRNVPELCTGPLFALPTHLLPRHALSTHQMLMRRLRATQASSPPAEQVEHAVAEALESPDQAKQCLDALRVMRGPTTISLDHHALITGLGEASSPELFLKRFCVLRCALEYRKDARGLAALISSATATDDVRCLATAADTFTRHAETFAAMGQLQFLADLLVDRYRTVRSQQVPDRTLILSLRSLVSLIPDMSAALKFLTEDLTVYDQQSLTAVCSPASDSLINMSASSLESDGDIDAVFASGNTMDEQLMRRVFARIAKSCQSATARGEQPLGNICRWLNQLRSLDAIAFANIVQGYVVENTTKSEPPVTFSRVMRALVASDCFSLSQTMNLCKDKTSSGSTTAIIRLLVEDEEDSRVLRTTEEYRFLMLRDRLISEKPGEVADLIATAVGGLHPSLQLDGLAKLVLELRSSSRGLDIFSSAASTMAPEHVENYRTILTKVLRPRGPERSNCDGGDKTLTPATIVSMANPLCVTYCTTLLQLASKEGSGDDMRSAAQLGNAILDVIQSGSTVWPQLLQFAGPEATRCIYLWARTQALACTGDESASDMQRTLDILDVSCHALKEDDSNAVIAAIVDKLRGLESAFNPTVEAEHQAGPIEDASERRLQVLLHLSVLYSSSPNEEESDGAKQTRSNLVAALCTLLVLPALHKSRVTAEFLYDVTSFLADALSAPAIHAIARGLAPVRDSRLVSILGLSPSSDSGLALATHPQSTPGASSQQRILAKQASTSSIASARPAPPSSTASQQQMPKALARLEPRETKLIPFPLKAWEILPSVGGNENDTSLSLSLFGARKVYS